MRPRLVMRSITIAIIIVPERFHSTSESSAPRQALPNPHLLPRIAWLFFLVPVVVWCAPRPQYIDRNKRNQAAVQTVEPKTYTIVGLGELLWDLFPGKKQLGGAPANFSYMTHLLGDTGIIASRLGNDPLGVEARESLDRLQIDASNVQTDPTNPTGTVVVQLAADGQPSYQIIEPVAWDFLEWTPAWQHLARHADAVCFGSLSQRSRISHETVRTFLRWTEPTALRVFDVTLRQNFYSRMVLEESIRFANIVKCNEEELTALVQVFSSAAKTIDEAAHWLLGSFDVELVCVTRGARGSILFSKRGSDIHPGLRVQVVDTVGAGDAFAAALVHHYLRGSSLKTINQAANQMGAWVASQARATPPANEELLERVRTGIS
jgi:fructokinase